MDELTDFVITIEMVKLNSLHTGKASGPNGMPTCVLPQAAEELKEPFTHLTCSSFPLIQDNSQLSVKKGSKTTARNYRPVSLTCILCKVMEKLV